MTTPRLDYLRLCDDEYVDEVTFRVVPRLKSSGLSGDEWRVACVVELRRKGAVIFERGYMDLESAAAHVGWLLKTWSEGPEAEALLKAQRAKDNALCFQPGCAAVATRTFELKQRFSREGFVPDPERPSDTHYRRAFCEEHAYRGDSDLEDSDANYGELRDGERALAAPRLRSSAEDRLESVRRDVERKLRGGGA